MVVSTIEQGISPETVRHNRKYASLVKDALGIISRLSPDALRVSLLFEEPDEAQKIAGEMEKALSTLGPKSAELLRAKHGLLGPDDQPRSFQELAAFTRGSSSTVSRTYHSAVNSLRYRDRLDGLKRAVYPERYQS